MLRSGLEVADEKRTTKRPWSSANYAKGFYREQYIKNHEYNNDVYFRTNRALINSISLHLPEKASVTISM
jgi:hypothetical protein